VSGPSFFRLQGLNCARCGHPRSSNKHKRGCAGFAPNPSFASQEASRVRAGKQEVKS
jgi:hypothetical protein